MSWPSALSTEWRQLANQQRDLGADAQACTLEWCADRLGERSREWRNEKLTLEEAARESGYSHDHVSRLLRDGTLPNAGKPGSPRIRRRDLPRKPGHRVTPARVAAEPVGSKTQMARSVVDSD